MSTPLAHLLNGGVGHLGGPPVGSFLPPAITTGTGQVAVTFSKPSSQKYVLTTSA